MTGVERARAIAAAMMHADAYSRGLGMELVDCAPGRSTIRLTVRDDMVNGFGVVHGGVLFSLADSALALASNSHGPISVAVDCVVSFTRAVRVGDTLTAEAIEESRTRSLGFCGVTVRNQHDQIVGHFRGTVYQTAGWHDSAGPRPPEHGQRITDNG